MLSPRSRGKGSRRRPWRDGGRRKWRSPEWRKQAVHAIEDFPKEAGELVEMFFFPCDRSAAKSIYLFDQRIAHTGIKYQAELHGKRFTARFIIRVPASDVATVSEIIAQIGKR